MRLDCRSFILTMRNLKIGGGDIMIQILMFYINYEEFKAGPPGPQGLPQDRFILTMRNLKLIHLLKKICGLGVLY